jgi:hypothetical protein
MVGVGEFPSVFQTRNINTDGATLHVQRQYLDGRGHFIVEPAHLCNLLWIGHESRVHLLATLIDGWNH